MSSASPTDSPMTGSPPRESLVDALYDLFIELPTVDDNGAHLSIGKFRQAMVGMLNEPSPSLGDVSPLTLMGLGPFSFPPRTPPSAFTRELEALRDHLNLRMDALQGAIEGLQRSPLPSAPVPALPTNPPVSKPRVKRPCAQPPTPAPAKALPAPVPAPAPVSRPTPPPAKPSFASMAKAPARPSLVVSLRPPVAGASHPPAVRRSPQEIVEHLNAVLAPEDHRVTLSAARWTAKNNLVVTAGPDTTAHHLTSASHLISDCLATFLSADQSPLPVQTRENCKWARLLVNGIPTGVSLTRGPYSPSELHAALLADNPAYQGLRLTQPPSWVRAPSTYTPGSVSSLVLTFEDPLGDSSRSLLAERSLFAFGHSGELKRWKTKPRSTAKSLATAPPLDQPTMITLPALGPEPRVLSHSTRVLRAIYTLRCIYLTC
ncbi:hypothetical protein EDB85DRAFT_2186399 [Lactarius pseudohatsudake]|nr:hypothetical protein EDB85DRAFT_2186399 [Lactarius pseudohatsudake]